MGESFSEWRSVTNGVPRRLVLGPQLFVICINNLVVNIGVMIGKLADDTNIVGIVGSE